MMTIHLLFEQKLSKMCSLVNACHLYLLSITHHHLAPTMMSSLEKTFVAVMLTTAVLGTIWYIYLELQTQTVGGVGWSLVVVVWFVILRRLFYLWRRGKGE